MLENGPAAVHAHFFDIDWNPVKAELRNKVLLPILGDQYGVVLERGELQLEYQGGSHRPPLLRPPLPAEPAAPYQDVLGPGVEQVGAQLGEPQPDFVELAEHPHRAAEPALARRHRAGEGASSAAARRRCSSGGWTRW